MKVNGSNLRYRVWMMLRSLMGHKLNHAASGVVLILGGLVCVQDAAGAGLSITIDRPGVSEACSAPGGLFAISGRVWAYDVSYRTVTKVEVFRGTTKLGEATLNQKPGYPDGYNEWRFPWTNVVTGSSTLKAVGYSVIGSGSVSVTATFTVTNNAPPIATAVGAQINHNETDYCIAASYTDANASQFWSASVVQQPSHGTASNGPAGSATLRYTPAPGYIGLDSFTYRVSDGVTNSSEATCRILVREANSPSGAVVMVVVNSNLLVGALSNQIMRLKSDLESEHYTAKIRPWPSSGTTSSNVWSCLHAEYADTNQFFVGAILIGNIPKPQAGGIYNELLYWNMDAFQTTSSAVNTRHIWVSRINADNVTWGSEATLIGRALDANHDYRTGQSRLPFTAYRYKNPTWWNNNNSLTDSWPVVEQRGATTTNLRFLAERTDLGSIAGADCMVKGGDLFEEESHGNSTGYMNSYGWITKNVIHRNLVQVRSCLIGSCSSGVYGGIANEQIFSRGGGCVLSIAASATSYIGEGVISDDPSFMGLLNKGRSWGDALVENFTINQYSYTTLFGDLSLRPMASVFSNNLPAISRFVANRSTVSIGQPVTFTVTSSDSDGAVSNIEWFLTGHNFGRATPTSSGTATNVVYSYPSAGVYTARVEVIDNYKARTWREALVTVTASTSCTLTAVKTGDGETSLGSSSPASIVVPQGITTQIVFTAADWHRIQTLSINNVAVDAAVGKKVYTQMFANIAADITNLVTFAPATSAQTGYANVPTSWLANWPENALIADPAFDIHEKYLIGLDPTTSNTFSLMVESFSVSGSNAITVLKREYTGGLSPDGMHGQLILQAADTLDSAFTNIVDSAVTGVAVFDGAGRKTYTNAIGGTHRFIRAVIQ
jgi:hypothetical protein